MANTTVKAYSVGGAVGIAIGLIGAGIQLRWPDKNVGTWLIVAGSTVLAAAVIAWIVRKMTIREYERTHTQRGAMSIPAQQLTQTANSHNEFKPHNQNVVNVHVPVSQDQAVRTGEREKDFAEPHIEFTNAFVEPRMLDSQDRLIFVPASIDNSATCLLARFYYKPERNVPFELNTKALISIANSAGVPVKTRYDGLWDGNYDTEYTEFYTAKHYTLVIALLPPVDVNERESIVTWGLAPNDHTVLVGSEFLFTIELVGKYRREPVLQASFNFRLKVTPPSFEIA